jgi:hypothetical protein
LGSFHRVKDMDLLVIVAREKDDVPAARWQETRTHIV